MPLYAHLNPAPFTLAADGAGGAEAGVLCVHGFTGAPTEMRRLGTYLHAQGFHVEAPLLAGHGTRPEDLERTSRHQWLDGVRSSLQQMKKRHRRVFVVGQSLGGLLALALAAEAASSEGGVDGVVCLAPALLINRLAHFARLPLGPLRFFPKYEEKRPDLVDKAALREVWSYEHTPLKAVREVLAFADEVRARLPAVTPPLLVVQGRRDKTVRPVGARVVFDGVASEQKELVWLEQTAHIVSVDGERDTVFAKTHAFLTSIPNHVIPEQAPRAATE